MSTVEALQGEPDIRKGFEAFIDAARRLEQSYTELQARAAAIDTQLAETNRELESTLLEREMVFASLPVGLLSLGPDGCVRWCNPEAIRLRDAAARMDRQLDRLADGDWQVGQYNLRVRRVSMPDGGTLILVEDRSRVVDLEQEVGRLDRLAGLSELALGIAHEIKNPLNGVMGFAGLLRRTDDASKQKRYAKKIETGLAQVDSIVKALLAFARPADKQDQPGTVCAVIADAATAAGVPSERVTVTYDDACEPSTMIEAPILIRVLHNLFRNGAEAKSPERVMIQVECTVRNHHVVITIRDDGPGVPREDAERIFQPFFTTKDRGHGLGLALACRVLAFLGGNIELQNPGETGAKFQVTIPLIPDTVGGAR